MRATSFISEPKVRLKISQCRGQAALILGSPLTMLGIPQLPARDVQVLSTHQLPKKLGLAHPLGLGKLIHDLANIELQAMELAGRTLIEYPEAHVDFRQALCQIMLEEAEHLELCLNELHRISLPWGRWPVHLGLWSAVSREDTLLERIFIVHRYLEASGLDAGEKILKRLSGAQSSSIKKIVKRIVEDEVGHVAFGSKWYNYYCAEVGVDPHAFYLEKTKNLLESNPKPGKLAVQLRKEAGYTATEIKALQDLKKRNLGEGLSSPIK